MSVMVNTEDVANGSLVLFEETEPVGLPAVQETLSALWRLASEQVQEEMDDALSRACLWNLVPFHSNPKRRRGDSAGEAHRIETLLRQVTVSVPARVIHLEEWRNEAAPEPGKEVEAWVSSHCLHTAQGPHLVCCEQVNLAGYGEQGHSHFPALVRALLVPDLPVALLWLDDVPRKGHVLGELLQLSDRMIIDNQHTTDPVSLTAVHELLSASPGKVTDLSWLRLNPLRHLLADFFDPPGRAEQLQHLERILIETSPEGRNSGLLLLGWLLSRCGYEEYRGAKPEGDSALHWQVQRGKGKGIPLDFRMGEGYGGLDGIFCIRIEAGGDAFELRDVDPEHMSMEGPDRTLPRVALRESSEPELVGQALSADPHDPVYAAALAAAARLVACARWNP
jgi:Glucose-6-phosphate dehydrogenase subunit N-terminal domain/Glucose-6-phosphate dehydrogenase subunit C-terminal domain